MTMAQVNAASNASTQMTVDKERTVPVIVSLALGVGIVAKASIQS